MSGYVPTPVRPSNVPLGSHFQAEMAWAEKSWANPHRSQAEWRDQFSITAKYRRALFKAHKHGVRVKLGDVYREIPITEFLQSIKTSFEFIFPGKDKEVRHIAREHYNAVIAMVLYITQRRPRPGHRITLNWEQWKALRDAAKVCS